MQIIESTNVDLIQPFPIVEIKRLINWLHCYKTLMQFDGMPASDEEMEQYCLEEMNRTLNWGVIDKTGKLGYKHEAPLIGVLWVDAGGSPANVYFHFASTRRAWGSGLLLEAAEVCLKHLFDTYPTLTRISGFILNDNKPAKAYLKRLGFKQDGLFKDFVTQKGQPKAMAHFGLTRKEAACLTHSVPTQNLSNPPASNSNMEVKEPALEASQTLS